MIQEKLKAAVLSAHTANIIRLNNFRRGLILKLSWFKTLADTYDNISEMKGNILLPPNHTTKNNSDVCVTIDGNGTFRNAEQMKLTIPIPCTEDSGSRSGRADVPHPLHDQIEYLSTNEKNVRNICYSFLNGAAYIQRWKQYINIS